MLDNSYIDIDTYIGSVVLLGVSSARKEPGKILNVVLGLAERRDSLWVSDGLGHVQKLTLSHSTIGEG